MASEVTRECKHGVDQPPGLADRDVCDLCRDAKLLIRLGIGMDNLFDDLVDGSCEGWVEYDECVCSACSTADDIRQGVGALRRELARARAALEAAYEVRDLAYKVAEEASASQERLAKMLTVACNDRDRLRAALANAEQEKHEARTEAEKLRDSLTAAMPIMRTHRYPWEFEPCLICTRIHPLDGPCGDHSKGASDGE